VKGAGWEVVSDFHCVRFSLRGGWQLPQRQCLPPAASAVLCTHVERSPGCGVEGGKASCRDVSRMQHLCEEKGRGIETLTCGHPVTGLTAS
jgi:hypothetical protein